MKSINWIKIIKISSLLACVAVLTMGVLAGVLALLVHRETISLTMAKTTLTIVEIVIVLLIGMVAAKNVGRRKMVTALIVGIIVIALLLLVKLTAFSMEGFSVLPKMLLEIAAAAVAGIVSSQKKVRR